MSLDRKKICLALKGAVSIALLGYIFRQIDWQKIPKVLSQIDLFPLGVTLFLNALGVFLSVVKWQKLLNVYGISRPLRELHGFYYMGFFFNNFLPSMVGGDLFRVVKTSGEGKHRAQAFSAVFAERLTGLIMLLFFASAAAALNLYRNVPVGVDWLVWLFLAIGVMFILGWLAVSFLDPTSIRSSQIDRWISPIVRAFDVFREYLRYPGVLARVFVISAAFHLLLILNGYLFTKSIGLDVDFLSVAVIFPVTILVATVPISFNGFGIKEGSLVVLFSQIGVGTEEALIVAGLSRLFVILASILGAFLFMLGKGDNAMNLVSEKKSIQ